MERGIRGLLALFFLQIALVFALTWNEYRTSDADVSTVFLSFEPTEVDAISLDDGKDVLRLERSDGRWILPNTFDFPASTTKVDEFLQTLTTLHAGFPVGNTLEAAKRFKVVDSAFERKVTFSNDDGTLATLYLGTSPGFKKVHARRGEQEETYAIPFSLYLAATKPAQWEDQQFLHLDPATIERIGMPSFTLQRSDGAFTLSDLGPTEQIAEAPINDLLDRITRLDFQEVIGKGDLPKEQMGDEKFYYTIELKSGEKVHYSFSKPKGTSDYVLTVSSTEYRFKVPSYTVEAIQKVTRDDLLSKEPPPAPDKPNTALSQ